MGYKHDDACLQAALDDEPLFVLLARDPSAPAVISNWNSHRLQMVKVGAAPKADIEKIRSAETTSQAMKEWRSEAHGKWRQAPLFPDSAERPGPTFKPEPQTPEFAAAQAFLATYTRGKLAPQLDDLDFLLFRAAITEAIVAADVARANIVSLVVKAATSK